MAQYEVSLALTICESCSGSVAVSILFYEISIVCIGSVFRLCFVMHYYVSFLVMQSS